jgi:hypothetical protein
MRWALAAGLLALAACVNDAGAPAPESVDVSISGQLTLKGPEPSIWWAVTDDEGRVWKISSPTPEQLLILERAQNQQVSIEGRRLEKDLDFEQIEPVRITPAPALKP